MGIWEVLGSTRVVPLPAHPPSHTPGTPLPTTLLHAEADTVLPAEYKQAVGLISVAQLSLWLHISETGTITEVYNLVRIGRIINHLSIPGNE